MSGPAVKAVVPEAPRIAGIVVTSVVRPEDPDPRARARLPLLAERREAIVRPSRVAKAVVRASAATVPDSKAVGAKTRAAPAVRVEISVAGPASRSVRM